MSRSEEFTTGRVSNPRSAVIFDMDGTLADVSGIRHHVEGGPENNHKKDFETFHAESVNSPANDHVVNHAQMAKMLGHDVIVVTARDAKWRNHTAMWLAQNRVPSDAMYMRAAGDRRPDYEVKKDILGRISKSWNVVHAVDDNPNVLKLWQENDIPTTKIEGWKD